MSISGKQIVTRMQVKRVKIKKIIQATARYYDQSFALGHLDNLSKGFHSY